MSRPEVTMVRDWASLEALAPEWQRLAERFATPMLDPDWSIAAARTLHHERDLRVVVVRQHGTLTGIAPLVEDGGLAGRIGMLGASTLYEPGGWLFHDAQVVTTIARAVARLGRVTVLPRVPADSVLTRTVSTALRGRGLVITRPATPTWGVDTSAGWTSHQRLMPGRARRKLSAQWQQARRSFDEVTVTHARPADADQVLQEFMPIEASGWKARNRSALAQRADLQSFFAAYLQRLTAGRRLVVSTLRFDGRIAAQQLAVDAYRRRWQLKIAYHESFASLGPGVLLTDATITAACQDGSEGVEFLGVAEHWQERWAPAAREFRAVVAYPFSSRAVVGALSDGARYVRRRWQRRISTDAHA